MPNIDLTNEEMQALITILVDAPWKVANPLLVKIQQSQQGQMPIQMQKTNSKSNERRISEQS